LLPSKDGNRPKLSLTVRSGKPAIAIPNRIPISINRNSVKIRYSASEARSMRHGALSFEYSLHPSAHGARAW